MIANLTKILNKVLWVDQIYDSMLFVKGFKIYLPFQCSEFAYQKGENLFLVWQEIRKNICSGEVCLFLTWTCPEISISELDAPLLTWRISDIPISSNIGI